MKILEVISEKNASPSGSMGLTIFDIDDTLFHTTAQIKVIKDGKVVKTLTNQEFNNYQLQPEEEFDFGEFRNAEKFAKESEPIKPMINTLKRILDRASNTKVIMLTARADFDDKDTFLNTFEKYGIDMSRIHVHRAGNLPGDDPPAIKKAVWVRKYLNTGKYNRVNLIDDSMSNLTVFKSLQSEYPQVDFDAYFVKPSGSIDVVSESRKRKKAKKRKNNSLFSRNTGGVYGAWGPGPYGGYGYDAGYSGDGGDGGGGESVNEKIGDVTQPVEPGDTVYSIARQNNLDPAELMKFNGFTINTKLKPGQEVKIPQKKSTAPTTPSKKSTPVAGQGAQPTPITGSSLETTLRSFAIKAGIKGKELAQFLAQCAHETANFATLTEFGDDFKKYDVKFNPQKAKTLGNTNPGDGERFKGRGFIQLTGRWNYTQAGQALGLPLDQKPQLLERPDVAAKASVWYWKNRVQPNVSNFTDTRAVTSYINPGLAGLQQRNGLFQNYLQTMQQPVKENVIQNMDFIDVYLRGRHKGNLITKPVAKNFPNQKLDQLIQFLVDKHGVNPKAVVYGPSKGDTKDEDYHPNDTPPGPETKPTMPAGTVKVDVSDVYDWYKLGQHISNLKGLGKHDFGKGPPSTIISFGSEEEEHKYMQDLMKLGLDTTDIDPVDPRQPKGMKRQKTDPTYKVDENAMRSIIYTKPNLENEWEEAARYPEFVKLGKDAWIELAKKGKAVTINSAKGINNTDAGEPDSFKSLVPAKQKRALAQLKKGIVEMPIVAVYSDGHKELIGGNTRLTAMMARNGKATIWAFRVPGKQGMAENFADGKNPQDKGDSKRHGIPKKASISTLKSIRSSDTASPRKKQLAHWQINMKQGRQK
jgi:predicted chitinase